MVGDHSGDCNLDRRVRRADMPARWGMDGKSASEIDLGFKVEV